jgi:hypothetical protein
MNDGIQDVQVTTSDTSEPFILMAFANLVPCNSFFSVNVFQNTVTDFYFELPSITISYLSPWREAVDQMINSLSH